MKKSIKFVLVAGLLLVLGASSIFAGGEAWFDMEKCEMCKPLAQDPDLLMNVTWEQHNISNGIVSVTTVEKGYLDAYRKAHAGMEQAVNRMKKGEQLEMCGMCTALGGLMMKGVKQEAVVTTHGDVMILTSDKTDVVAGLQKWAARNKEEMKKMESHDHGG